MAPFKLFTLMYWAVDDLYKHPDVVFSRLTSELNVACVSPLADNHTVVRPFEFESTRLRVFMLLAKVQDLPQRQPSEVPPPPPSPVTYLVNLVIAETGSMCFPHCSSRCFP